MDTWFARRGILSEGNSYTASGNRRRQEVVEPMSVLRPFTFVMQDEDGETLTDLYIVDDQETVIISSNLLEDVDQDLDNFFNDLMKE